MRQIVLDTETTGLKVEQGHRIIEIGAVELINRRFTGKHFHHYLNPERDIEIGALQVHGITREFLADKPLFKDIAATLLEFIQDAELIIHNAAFDIGFLNRELKLIKHKLKDIKANYTIVDTLLLARQKHPGQQNNLDALCKRYKVDNSGRDFHGALLDARLLADVYLAMTGGQSSLFGESETVIRQPLNEVTPTTTTIALEKQAGLRVIYANAAELEAHQQLLAKLNKQSGRASSFDGD